jgi:hypothetical protein
MILDDRGEPARLAHDDAVAKDEINKQHKSIAGRLTFGLLVPERKAAYNALLVTITLAADHMEHIFFAGLH